MRASALPIVGSLLLAAACGSSRDPAGLTSGDGSVAAAAIVETGGEDRAWPTDPILVRTAAIRGDSLYLEAEHGGGCATHAYGLVVGPAWLESYPVQIGGVLAHDANGDHCRALLRPSLAFSLVPVRDAYRQMYQQTSGTIVINLQPGGHRLEYRF